MFYAFILLLYKDPGSGICKALFSRIPDPLKKAKDPADLDSTDPDPDLHHCFRVHQNFDFININVNEMGSKTLKVESQIIQT